AAHRTPPPPAARAGEGRGAAADRQGRTPRREGAPALRGAAHGDAGRVRRLGFDRQALPPPGRDRHPVGADDRPRDARGGTGDDPRPRHARAGADPDRRCARPPARAAPGPVGAPVLAPPKRWQQLSFESEALRDNPLGDPYERPVYVWTPPTYDEDERRYP